MFENEPLLVNGIGRDGDLSPVTQFMWHLYGAITQSNVDQARLQLFSKANKGLEMLPSMRDALALHICRANYQAKQADREHIDVSSPAETSSWTKEQDCLLPVWTRLPPTPDACL